MARSLSSLSVNLQSSGVTCRALGLGICFSLYYAFYFMNFSEGSVQGSHAILYAAKLLGLVMLAIGFMPYRFDRRVPLTFWAFIILNGWFFANYLAAYFLYPNGDSLFLNQILFIPFGILLFQTAAKEPLTETMNILLPFLLLQVITSEILKIVGLSLWQNFAFVGGMGNPNSFGFTLVLLLIYMWTVRVFKYEALLAALLIAGAILTQSLMITCLVLFVPMGIFALERNFRQLVQREILCVSIMAYCSVTGASYHVTRKILAVLHKFGLADYNTPIGSIDGRVDQLHYVQNALEHSRPTLFSYAKTLLWGHDDGAAFTPIDPQYLCFALNFGVIFSVIFAAFNLFFLAKAVRTAPKYRTFLFVALLAFNLSFLTNRLLAYFPMGFLYMLIVASIFSFSARPSSASARTTALPAP
jgi:hypothetical protein